MGQQGAGVVALVFRAGPLFCALPLAEVIESMRPLPTRPLAGTPHYVRGLTILRGEPSPVIDVTRLLTGVTSEVDRYIAVRAGRGPVACATGPVLGVQDVHAMPPDGPSTMFTGASRSLVAAVGRFGTEPLLVLRSIRTVPDEVWEAAARETRSAAPETWPGGTSAADEDAAPGTRAAV
ncbi:chemotaxis protein CheW [Actinoplanes sp. HUAS TT8]|uniref:chemotaxis protein CheW n=1 Tax=Actinoplanes sp. HUAS TT8 TaxID=3447453 RepID=UPI003F523434